MAIALHDWIVQNNILEKPTDDLYGFFREHPNLYKVALLANHIFRAVAMSSLSMMIPFSAPVNLLLCFAGSLFYRLTVETHCAYKFALPAFAGSVVFTYFSQETPLFSLLSLGAYLAYITLTVSYDVDHR